MANCALVANAEIYHFREVLASLPRPPVCRSTSDCEAIIHAFNAWGIDCVHRLRGMFAFLLDDGGSSVYAVRDPLGIKPLFYGTNQRGETWFASEVYALCDHCSYIQSVPPGHYWHNGTIHAWYSPKWLPAPQRYVQPRDDLIAGALREAVRLCTALHCPEDTCCRSRSALACSARPPSTPAASCSRHQCVLASCLPAASCTLR